MTEDPIETHIAMLSDLWQDVPEAEEVVHRAVDAVGRTPGVTVPPDAQLSFALADDEQVRVLNRDYRAKDKPTNVLSFPAVHGPLMGDVIVAYETLAREAEEEGISKADHLAHLTVHGVLHLLGYDHETEDEAVAMEALETAILAGLGIKDPHASGRAMPGESHV
jgi:probable rRNA maturation factor